MIILIFTFYLVFCQLESIGSTTINDATPYKIVLFNSDDFGSNWQIHFRFSTASELSTSTFVSAESEIPSKFASGSNPLTADVDTSDSTVEVVRVKDLINGRNLEYKIQLNDIKNPPVGREVSDIECRACSDDSCSTQYASAFIDT